MEISSFFPFELADRILTEFLTGEFGRDVIVKLSARLKSISSPDRIVTSELFLIFQLNNELNRLPVVLEFVFGSVQIFYRLF